MSPQVPLGTCPFLVRPVSQPWNSIPPYLRGSDSIPGTSVYRMLKWGRKIVRRPQRAQSDCPTTGDRGAASLSFVVAKIPISTFFVSARTNKRHHHHHEIVRKESISQVRFCPRAPKVLNFKLIWLMSLFK